jgi:EAL domain-containing protein (putative c-di-GMP-specific phosphodiesterase class I)
MVALAGEIGLHVVAEGVETPAELRELTRLGVRSVQGFHLARPAPAAHFELLLEPRADAA